MISFLPDMTAAPSAPSGPIAGPMTSTAGGAALDFAGLLNAAMPAAVSLFPSGAQGAAPEQASPDASTLPPGPMLTAPILPATRLPGGTIMPDGGTHLPDAVPVVASEAGPVPERPAAESPALMVAAMPPQTAAMPVNTGGAAEPAAAIPAEPEETDDTVPAPAPFAAPIPAPIALAVAVAAMPHAPAILPAVTARPASRTPQHPAAPPMQVENAAMPERAALFSEPADAPATLSAPAAAPLMAEAAAPDAAPATQAAPTTQPTTAPLAPAPNGAPVMAERAEPRAPAINQESTIAQVGELREALRAVRPEMTLRHAEFGFVSLRIEAAGAQDWRAVLASRDPGFVPAVQAALADRAVSASSETASTGTGQNGTGQNGAGQNGSGDQRYGSSPNGGQGPYQPYLAQSSGGDEGGSSHRNANQPSTTDTVAGRAGDDDAEQADPAERGVFA